MTKALQDSLKIKQAYREAHEKGLSDDWICSIDVDRDCCVWMTLDGKITCESIPEALEKSRGLLPSDTEGDTGKGKRNRTASTTSQGDEADKEIEPDRPQKTPRSGEKSDSVESKEDSDVDDDDEEEEEDDDDRSTTSKTTSETAKVGLPTKNDEDQKLFLRIEKLKRKAKEQGLPDGWTCSINDKDRCEWTPPGGGKKCKDIPAAIKESKKLGLLPANTEEDTGRGKGNRTASVTSQNDETKEEGEPIRPRKSTRLNEISESEVAEKDSGGDEASGAEEDSKEVLPKKNGDGEKHTDIVQQQSQPIESSRSGTAPVASVQPEPPYEKNVFGGMVWLRSKRRKRHWIRGKIVGSKLLCFFVAPQEEGNTETFDELVHVIDCVDDEVYYEVNLEKEEQLGNLIWM